MGLEITGISMVDKAQGWMESEKGDSGSSKQYPLCKDNQKKDTYKEAEGVGEEGKMLSP